MVRIAECSLHLSKTISVQEGGKVAIAKLAIDQSAQAILLFPELCGKT